MKNRKIKWLLLSTFIIVLLVYWLWPKHNATIVYRDPEIYGIVGDEETARKIAETIWLPIYGDIIYKSKPYVATLRDSIWVVKGTLHAERGGTPYIEISRRDGRVIKVLHGK